MSGDIGRASAIRDVYSRRERAFGNRALSMTTTQEFRRFQAAGLESLSHCRSRTSQEVCLATRIDSRGRPPELARELALETTRI